MRFLLHLAIAAVLKRYVLSRIRLFFSGLALMSIQSAIMLKGGDSFSLKIPSTAAFGPDAFNLTLSSGREIWQAMVPKEKDE